MLAAHRVLHAPVFAVSYNSTILADSPVAFWPLNESSGTTATDATGNGHNGTYTGGFTLGQTGIGDGETAVSLDGATGYVNVPYASALDLANGPFTLEAWANVSSPSGKQYGLISNGVHGYYYRIGASSSPNGQIDLIQDYTTDLGSTSALVSGGTWYYIVWTRNGSSNHVYVNAADVTPTLASATLTTSSLGVALGVDRANGGGITNWLAGSLAKCAIYNNVLTSTQVSNHYAAA